MWYDILMLFYWYINTQCTVNLLFVSFVSNRIRPIFYSIPGV